MKKYLLVFALPVLMCCFSFFSEGGQKTFANEKFKVKFGIKDGMYEGLYVSYYSNGKKKAEGHFSCNQRIGMWAVWDSTGKIIVKREYKNDYEYKQLLPESGSKTIVPPVYSLVRNEAGFYPYFNFKQSDVLISKRIWREIGKDDESSFFGNDNLYHALIDSVSKGKIKIYDSSSDELVTLLSAEKLKKLKDTSGKEIIGFKIKEDWFFDVKRKTSEKRILAVCPVVCKKDTSRINDDDYSFDMGWFNFPDMRNTLASVEVQNSNPEIKNLDDLFFFRCFPSEIYKEANVRNLELKDYSKRGSMPDEQLRIEIELIETEHDLWMKYSK